MRICPNCGQVIEIDRKPDDAERYALDAYFRAIREFYEMERKQRLQENANDKK